MTRVSNRMCGITLVLALIASSASAGQAPVRSPAPPQRYHPYKKAGLIMMGIGALASVAAMRGVNGLEGIDFQTCVAGAPSSGLAHDACSDQRLPNPTLTAAGIFLLGGGALLALQRATRTPQIRIGYGRVAIVSGLSF
jgi:hypothetical protein